MIPNRQTFGPFIYYGLKNDLKDKKYNKMSSNGIVGLTSLSNDIDL